MITVGLEKVCQRCGTRQQCPQPPAALQLEIGNYINYFILGKEVHQLFNFQFTS